MTTKCLICGEVNEEYYQLDNMPSGAQLFSKNPKLSLLNTVKFKVFQCKSCGLVQAPIQKVPYYKKVIRSTKFSKEMNKFRTKQFRDLYNLLNKKEPSVFELGCGYGEYLDIFKKLNFSTHGIEYSKRASQICLDKKHNVYNDFLNSKKSLEKIHDVFDFVVSFQYIEHLPNPKKTLTLLSNLLSDKSYALLEVPNFDMINKYRLFNEFIPDHLSYFTKKSFELLIEISGFEIVETKTCWSDYIISVLAKKRKTISWEGYENKRQKLKVQILNFIEQSKYNEVAIWSAGHQSLATISNLEIYKKVAFFIDSASFKQDLYAPATDLKILSPNEIDSRKIKKIIVIASGFNNEIINFIKNNYQSEIQVAYIEKGNLIVT